MSMKTGFVYLDLHFPDFTFQSKSFVYSFKAYSGT